MIRLFALIIFLLSAKAHATRFDSLSFGLSAGLPFSEIKNPDSTTAYYSGLSLTGRGNFPLYSSEQFSTSLVGSLRYLDLKNTANNSTQSEIAQYLGPGVGMQFSLLKFVLGAEYYLMLARHYTVGTNSEQLNYQMMTLNYYLGYRVELGARAALAFSWSQASGRVPKKKTKFNSNSPYKDQVYWVHFIYFTGSSLSDFAKSLFRD